MLGNDLIDLSLPDNQGKAQQPRLLQKICTPSEQDYIRQQKDPHRALWQVWSCKESAYKVAIKNDYPPCYRPLDLCVLPYNEQSAIVQTPIGMLHTRTFFADQYLHTIATLHLAQLDKVPYKIWELPTNNEQYPPEVLREYYHTFIGEELQLPVEQLQIRKNALHIPQVYCQEQLLPCDISISDDGNFIAVALLQL
ncbi:MAG TPA: 4'-phosphopantetheinyl transferase superfamily protein [Chitinophagales bacterium]|nr:4'-phosphopantetheinyl transferase superfamily protein [Chitinophagales bacterium]